MAEIMRTVRTQQLGDATDQMRAVELGSCI